MPESEVRLSYNSLINNIRPDISLLWSNRRYISWAKESGYSGVEFIPLRGAVRDILKNPIEVISTLPEIKTGHVFYNPYATFWSVIKREEDPLRPGTKLAYYNLLMADAHKGKEALHKLEDIFNDFPVVTYPFMPKTGLNYGTYSNPWMQTHPAVFNDASNEQDLIRLVRDGHYRGIVWDTFHAMEQTADGRRPLFDWEKSLRILLEAKVIREIHIQAARLTERYSKVPDFEWAKELTGIGKEGISQIGKLIKLVKKIDPSIPFVVEIPPLGLYKAGIIKPTSLISTVGNLQQVHRKIIEYIKGI